MNVDALLAPLSREQFLRDVWERVPRRLHAPGRAWDALLHPRDLDAMLLYGGPRVRAIKRGSVPYGALSGAADLDAMWLAYREGATLAVQAVECAWPAVGRFCADLTHFFSAPVRADLYIAPPQTQGYGAHHDIHDTFAVQLSGRKGWRLYDSRIALPLGDDTAGTPADACGEVREEVVLEAGDVLYLPRGVVHEAYSLDGPSVHLTLAVHVYRAVDLLVAALQSLAARDERLRRAIPIGLLRGEDIDEAAALLRDLSNSLPAASAADGVIGLSQRLAREGPRAPGGRFSALDAAPLELDTALRRMSGAQCRVQEDGSSSSIEFFGTVVRGPHYIAPALRFIADNVAFTPRRLPDLNDSSKLVLARRLMREGLLCHAAP